ncbi:MULTISPECIES: hypothetical protein [Cytobacillus]|uniref:hypothetical protein n=1 Tax=Cytobacillus TaxID=2675230 RepID=UPI001CD54731|nr:hypothetical protein [Cytobacillus kochii]MCA1024661.1 hypothetical protein [Cytobacillus kochii]MCM3323345.1 hypothetical protein [Cytobacillus kochii]MCM3345740.1 hypothetical protein [Cytobacillus kochii]MDM5206347.1 hypothetical protein [Cytobacillus kochii]
MKKVKASLCALLVICLIPITATASSGWDYLGEQSLSSNGAESEIYASTGGDYMICRDNYVGPKGKVKVELWEYDPESYNDYVGYRNIARGECGIFRSIGKFVDGGNEAEFFAKSRTSSNIHLIFYD